MKRILFPGLLVAGLLISISGFSQRYYGHRGGFGFPHPRVFVRPFPARVILPPVYPGVYAPAYGYGSYGYGYGGVSPYYYPGRAYRRYPGPAYRRPYYGGGHSYYRGRSRHR